MTVALAEIQAFMATDFPQSGVTIESVGYLTAQLRQVVDDRHIRPGNTISGPTMMALADCALYVALLGEYGLIPLAVTTNLNINFLNKPPAGFDIIAKCRLLKTGKRLAVGDVELYSEGRPELIAHVTATYAIPPDKNVP